MALEHAGQRRERQLEVGALGPRARPPDDHAIGGARRRNGRRVPELTREDGAAGVEPGELRVERRGGQLQAVGLTRQLGRQAAGGEILTRRSAAPSEAARAKMWLLIS